MKRSWKEVGKSFSESFKGGIKKIVLPTATAAFLALSSASCTSDKAAYESGEIQTEIRENRAEANELVNVYNEYCQDREKRCKVLAELMASGDEEGYRKEWARIQELDKTIKKTKERIDKLGDEYIKLQEREKNGRVASKKESSEIDALKNRTFKEVQ